MLARVSFVWLYVTNLDESVRFYKDVLGLSLLGRWHEGASFNVGGLILGLHVEEGQVTRGNSPIITFAVMDDIDATYRTLLNRGVKFLGPIQEEPYGKVVSFQDPDGHTLLLHQEVPSGASSRT